MSRLFFIGIASLFVLLIGTGIWLFDLFFPYTWPWQRVISSPRLMIPLIASTLLITWPLELALKRRLQKSQDVPGKKFKTWIEIVILLLVFSVSFLSGHVYFKKNSQIQEFMFILLTFEKTVTIVRDRLDEIKNENHKIPKQVVIPTTLDDQPDGPCQSCFSGLFKFPITNPAWSKKDNRYRLNESGYCNVAEYDASRGTFTALNSCEIDGLTK